MTMTWMFLRRLVPLGLRLVIFTVSILFFVWIGSYGFQKKTVCTTEERHVDDLHLTSNWDDVTTSQGEQPTEPSGLWALPTDHSLLPPHNVKCRENICVKKGVVFNMRQTFKGLNVTFNSTDTMTEICSSAAKSPVVRRTSPVFKQSQLAPDTYGRRLPDALIIGARKSGTGALRDFLSLHPRIIGPMFETAFFLNDVCYANGLDFYRSLLPAPAEGQILMEKSADYFNTARVPQRVYAMNHDIKLILVLNHPYNRLVSDYMFLQRYMKNPRAPEKNHTFEELAIVNGELNTKWECLKRSLYDQQLAGWLKWFPRKSILVINGESLATLNPAIELNKVEDFLGIERYLHEDNFYFNETKGFFCHSGAGCLHSGKGHTSIVVKPTVEQRLKDYLAQRNDVFFKNRFGDHR